MLKCSAACRTVPPLLDAAPPVHCYSSLSKAGTLPHFVAKGGKLPYFVAKGGKLPHFVAKGSGHISNMLRHLYGRTHM